MPEEEPIQEPVEGDLDPEERGEVAYKRERRTRRILSERRNTQFARAAVIGVAAGLIAVAFQYAIYGVEELRLFVRAYFLDHSVPGWLILPAIGGVVGLFAGWLVQKFAPETSGSGIPHVKAVLLHLRELHWVRVILVKFAGGVAALGSGLSLGREGPTVQMGAAVGKGLANVLKAPKRQESQLIAGGAGAGLAAAFNAPLAGFLFVIEELQRELSPLTYGTALIASVTASVVSRMLRGDLPSFLVQEFDAPPLSALPFALVVGLLVGVLGALFNKGLMKSLDIFSKIPRVKPKMRPALLGIAAGLIGWFFPTLFAGYANVPEIVGGGHHTAELLLSGEWSGQEFMWMIFGLMVAKFIFTVASYGTGAPGGIFAPMLLIGAMAGLLVGQVGEAWLPNISGEATAFAVIGMGAFFAASVRAPLTGVVLIMEMTANYEQLLALLIACFAAYWVAEHMNSKPIYEDLLARDLRRADPDVVQHGEPILMDIVVESDSELDGRRLKDSGLPKGSLIVTVTRAGEEIVPSGSTELKPGDELTIVVSGSARDKIHEIEMTGRARA